jgi:hypothetical protein
MVLYWALPKLFYIWVWISKHDILMGNKMFMQICCLACCLMNTITNFLLMRLLFHSSMGAAAGMMEEVLLNALGGQHNAPACPPMDLADIDR